MAGKLTLSLPNESNRKIKILKLKNFLADFWIVRFGFNNWGPINPSSGSLSSLSKIVSIEFGRKIIGRFVFCIYSYKGRYDVINIK